MKGDIIEEYEEIEDLDEEQMIDIFKAEGFITRTEEELK
jgi:hypothetical protein